MPIDKLLRQHRTLGLEQTDDCWPRTVGPSEGGKLGKFASVVVDPGQLDPFLDTLTAVVRDRQADLRGVTSYKKSQLQ